MKAEIDIEERFFEVEYEIEVEESPSGPFHSGYSYGYPAIESITEVFFNNNQVARKELNVSEFEKDDTESYKYLEKYLQDTIN